MIKKNSSSKRGQPYGRRKPKAGLVRPAVTKTGAEVRTEMEKQSDISFHATGRTAGTKLASLIGMDGAPEHIRPVKTKLGVNLWTAIGPASKKKED